MLNKQYNHGQLKQDKQFKENLKKFSSCLAQCLNACVHQTPVANFGSPKIFLLGIRFVSSLQEESQHGALAKTGDMQAGLETFNQQPCSPESCHSVTLAKVLLFGKAATFFAKKVTAAISFSRP